MEIRTPLRHRLRCQGDPTADKGTLKAGLPSLVAAGVRGATKRSRANLPNSLLPMCVGRMGVSGLFAWEIRGCGKAGAACICVFPRRTSGPPMPAIHSWDSLSQSNTARQWRLVFMLIWGSGLRCPSRRTWALPCVGERWSRRPVSWKVAPDRVASGRQGSPLIHCEESYSSGTKLRECEVSLVHSERRARTPRIEIHQGPCLLDRNV
jgi:hypothetical protein